MPGGKYNTYLYAYLRLELFLSSVRMDIRYPGTFADYDAGDVTTSYREN